MKVRENKFKTKWMECPKIATVFPGLAYILPLGELIIVYQQDSLHNLISKTGISYTIFNNQGQKVFLAVQESKWHKFNLKIFNYFGNEVIQVNRPDKLCRNKVLVWAPPGNFMGSVKEARSCINTFFVKNSQGKVILKIKAQGLFHYKYRILDNGEEIGMVKNNVAMFSTKNFGVNFPVEADLGDKIVLLGACFLIGCLKY